MADAKKKKKVARKAVMVGLGLDSDGHKRLTTGPNFVLMGGSKDTHEEMTEKAIKINEKLAATGKRLEDVSHEEFDEIAHSVGLPAGLPPHKPGADQN
jgi:seryl-tRNA(Sec) selenium transferase